MKLAYIDLETSGLIAEKHGVHQIAILVGNESLVIDCNVIPDSWIDDKALEIGGKTKEQLESSMSAREAKTKFDAFIGRFVDKFNKHDKLVFIGYNAIFDYQFLRSWYTRQGDKFFGSYFWHPPLDVMTLAGFHLMEKRPLMVDFKLGTVAKELGIAVQDTELHDALYDITLTKAIHEKLSTKNS